MKKEEEEEEDAESGEGREKERVRSGATPGGLALEREKVSC